MKVVHPNPSKIKTLGHNMILAATVGCAVGLVTFEAGFWHNIIVALGYVLTIFLGLGGSLILVAGLLNPEDLKKAGTTSLLESYFRFDTFMGKVNAWKPCLAMIIMFFAASDSEHFFLASISFCFAFIYAIGLTLYTANVKRTVEALTKEEIVEAYAAKTLEKLVSVNKGYTR